MSTTEQPEALQIAATLEAFDMDGAADAVRRLHAENTALQAGYDAARLEIESLRAGRVQGVEFGQFLSDVMTASGLVSYGKQCKALGDRLGEMVERLRAYADSDRAARAQAAPLPLTEQQAHDMGAKGATATDAERLLFEAWMRGHCWALSCSWRGTSYRSDAEESGDVDPRAMQTRRIWAAWRDRAALVAPAAPAKALPYEPTSAMLIAARECDPALPIETIRALWWAMWRTAPAAPAPGAPSESAGFALVPLRMTKAMEAVLEDEGWQWEELLAAAEAIDEAQYAALTAAGVTAGAVPDGYVLVPAQRLKNARALVDRGAWVEGAKVLDELLAAAPQPPAAAQEPTELTDSQIATTAGRLGGMSDSCPLGQQWNMVYALVRKVIKERCALPPEAQEPVAWLHTNRLGGVQAFTSEPPPSLKAQCQPLYTHPAPQQAATAKDALDAARYRWLRDQNNSLETQQRDRSIVNGVSCYHEVDGIRELKWDEELDAAIDAALAAQKGGA